MKDNISKESQKEIQKEIVFLKEETDIILKGEVKHFKKEEHLKCSKKIADKLIKNKLAKEVKEEKDVN